MLKVCELKVFPFDLQRTVDLFREIYSYDVFTYSLESETMSDKKPPNKEYS